MEFMSMLLMLPLCVSATIQASVMSSANMEFFFMMLMLLMLPLCVSATIQASVMSSVDLLVDAISKTKESFCYLLACVIQNYSLMMACRKLYQEGSDEFPELLEKSKRITWWHSFLSSINNKFMSYKMFWSLSRLAQKLIQKHRDAFGSPPNFSNVETTTQILNDLEMTSFKLALDKVTTPEEKLEAKRQAALKAAERKAAKKRENEMAQEQLTLMTGRPQRASKGKAAKKIKSSLAATEEEGDDQEEEEEEEGEGEDGEEMSDDDSNTKAETYIMAKENADLLREIQAQQHAIQGLQQQLDFVSAQNVAYQQRLQVLTGENEALVKLNEKLNEKVVDLQQENEALIQLNELTMNAATEDMKRKIEQLETENSLTSQVDDMAIDSTASASNGEESASESTTDE